MTRVARDAVGFRPVPAAAAADRPSRRQAGVLALVLVLVAAGVALAATVVQPGPAKAFDLLTGSVFINDVRAPVAVDLASGKPTVRLVDANAQVSARASDDLDIVPLAEGTLLLNRKTGEFNLVDASGFTVKKTGGGVKLPALAGATAARATPADALAYVLQSAPDRAGVYLVGEATVQSAAGTGTGVKPRASRVVDAPVAADPGAAVAADGDLWLLAGAGAARTVRRLHLPEGSDPGAVLDSSDHGEVSGAAALGVTERDGADVIALASTTGIRLLAPQERTLTVAGLGSADRIVPVANEDGRLAFLYHADSGWNIVEIDADDVLTGPTPVSGLDGAARVASPVASEGAVYTADAASGRIWRITAGTARQPDGAAEYPVARSGGRAAEAADFGDVHLVSRGSRVIVNSPNHVYALTLFADGSKPPQRIDKAAAVNLNAAGGAAAITRDRARQPGPDKPSTGPKRPDPPDAEKPAPPQAPVNTKIDCKTTAQVPHIPVITQAQPGSRSVQLQWTYPLLDTQDCAPSTYVVSVRLLSAQAPPAPGSATVQGQTGVNLTGLFPSTQYEIVVTAYINGRGTPSAPVRITTGPEGPAAPTDVRVSADGSGNWTVSWTSCGGVAQGCVPAASWNVVPSFCDGRGLSGQPPTISVAGDSTQRRFTATYPGGDATLGRGMTFQIVGIGTLGTVGTPASGGGCAYSWRPPIPSAMTVSASQPAQTSLGGTASTTVTIALGPNPVRAVGGLGAQLTFRLTGPSGSQTRTLTFSGSGSMSATFDGVAAGATYRADVIVAPPNHPEAAVTVGPVDVTTRAAWPEFGVRASFAPDRGLIVLSGTLTVSLTGISSAAAGGERFSLTDASQVVCGSTAFPLRKENFDPAKDAIVVENVSLLIYRGNCTVEVQLVESGGREPLVFGGTVSPTQSTTVNLGQASTLNAQQDDFTAAWTTVDNASHAIVKYTGPLKDSDVSEITTDWSLTLRAPAPASTECGSLGQQPTRQGVTFLASATCVAVHGEQTGWTVTVAYKDRAGGQSHSFTYTLAGTPPTFQPCEVDATQFTAVWVGTLANPSVRVTYGGAAARLAGCTNWAYALLGPTNQACGSGPDDPPTATGFAIRVTCAAKPAAGWKVNVTYSNALTGPQPAIPVPVTGPLPTA